MVSITKSRKSKIFFAHPLIHPSSPSLVLVPLSRPSPPLSSQKYSPTHSPSNPVGGGVKIFPRLSLAGYGAGGTPRPRGCRPSHPPPHQTHSSPGGDTGKGTLSTRAAVPSHRAPAPNRRTMPRGFAQDAPSIAAPLPLRPSSSVASWGLLRPRRPTPAGWGADHAQTRPRRHVRPDSPRLVKHSAAPFFAIYCNATLSGSKTV